MQNDKFVLILAGGVGSRFWPKSTSRKPKQFLDILGVGKSLLQLTWERARCMVPAEQILISTTAGYVELVLEQLPELSETNIIVEPARRNTAPSITYGMMKVKKRNPNAAVMVCPSDHLIMNQDLFCNICNEVMDYALANDHLITLGVKPHSPHTGYGYIQYVSPSESKGVLKVKAFTEKPSEEIAKDFIASGDFLWNAGIFFWNVRAFDQALAEFIPELHNVFNPFLQFIDTDDEVKQIQGFYPSIENESIDYAMLEKARNVYVVPVEVGWSDLGAWGALETQLPSDENNNVVVGKKYLLYDSSNNIIHLDSQKLAVIEGLEGYIVVDTPHALLICKKSSEQRVRDFVTDVRIIEGDRFV
jgi:mannose-1-phosphate guanylyltransferase